MASTDSASLPALNPSQTAAVHDQSPHLLIIAGPGTGKTHTLTCRIRHVLTSLNPQEKILAITFTRKAAGEMRDRLSADLNDDDGRIFVGTFHQWALQFLKKHAADSGLPVPLVITDEDETAALAKALWPSVSKRERRNHLEQISRYKAVEFNSDPPALVREYDAAIRGNGKIDYDDLLLTACRLLTARPDIREQQQAQLRFLFVDEFQDINPVQHALVRQLAGLQTHVTAIGDPRQSIYGFRGADPGCFDRFMRDFPGTKVVTLADNYRSTENLLAASRQVISAGEKGAVPALTARLHRAGHLIIRDTPTERAEAEYVVHQIERLVGGTSMFSQDSGRVEASGTSAYSFSDIAVLYRMHAQHRPLKEALERSGIPYHIHGPARAADDEDVICPLPARERDWEPEKVAVMTLHAAKGLEFPVVFIVGCEDGLIPLDLEGMQAGKTEERRLFYVGMTRAKERLYLVRAKKRVLHGKKHELNPSPFLRDIEEKLKELDRQERMFRKKPAEKQMDLF